MKHSLLSAAVWGVMGLGVSMTAQAVNFSQELCVGRFEKVLSSDPQSSPVPMWGYALGGIDTLTGQCAQTPTTPGPRITVPDGYDGLDLTVHNTLSRPTSVVIPGTVKPMQPVFFTPAGESIPRVRSFDSEAAPNGGSVSYSWDGLQPGSYMYQSGTHQQVQVQMGLYGALTRDSAPGEAYPGRPYSQDIVMFYYEIDRLIHDNADQGMYTESDMKSTVGYAPKYFLVDVDPGTGPITYEYNDLLTVKLPPNLNPLLRFYNAGQRLHVPTVFEAEFEIIAEDAKPYPSSRAQYGVELPPLKVRDAYLNISGQLEPIGGFQLPPSAGGVYRLTDSAMAVSNPDSSVTGPVSLLAANSEIANGSDNGMVLRFEVLPDPAYVAPVADGNEPRAIRDEFSVPEGGSLADIVALALSNDINATGATVTILSYPKQGDLIDNGQGRFTYQHDGSEQSRDSLVYALTNADGERSSTGVVIDIIPVNDAPVAADDTVNVRVGQTVEIRALANDKDVDSPVLTITGVDNSSLGLIRPLEQVIMFEAVSEGQEALQYSIADSSGATAAAMLNITVTPAIDSGSSTYGPGNGPGGSGGGAQYGEKPVTVADHYTVIEGGSIDTTGNPILGVLSNDSPGSRVYTGLAEYPEHGSIQMFEDGTFIYSHNGDDEEDDSFTYEAYNENGATTGEVSITVTPRGNPPRVNNDKAKTRVDRAVLINVLKNDLDKDSPIDPGSLQITEPPSHGSVDLLADGRIRYTPDAGFSGKDKFRYRLKDSVTGELSRRAAKVKVRVR